MNSNLTFKPFEIKGKNVADHVKKLGITRVPSILVEGGVVEGVDNIYKFIQKYDNFDKPIKQPKSHRPMQHRARSPVSGPKGESSESSSQSDFDEEDKKLYQNDEDSLERSVNEYKKQQEEKEQEESEEVNGEEGESDEESIEL